MRDRTFKKDIVSWVVAGISALTALIAYFFLPAQIPMQWNGTEVIWSADRLAIFAVPLLSILLAVFLKPVLRYALNKSVPFSPRLPDILTTGILLILLSCLVYTILYCFGFRGRLEYIVFFELFLLLAVLGISAIRSGIRRRNRRPS